MVGENVAGRAGGGHAVSRFVRQVALFGNTRGGGAGEVGCVVLPVEMTGGWVGG